MSIFVPGVSQETVAISFSQGNIFSENHVGMINGKKLAKNETRCPGNDKIVARSLRDKERFACNSIHCYCASRPFSCI